MRIRKPDWYLSPDLDSAGDPEEADKRIVRCESCGRLVLEWWGQDFWELLVSPVFVGRYLGPDTARCPGCEQPLEGNVRAATDVEIREAGLKVGDYV